MLCHTSLFEGYLLISGYILVFGEARKGVKTLWFNYPLLSLLQS